MKFYLAILALIGGAHASAVISRAPAGCENAVAIESKMLGAVNFTTFACGSPLSTVAAPFHSLPVAREPSNLETRQSGACTNPAPMCQSAVRCNSNFCGGTQAGAPLRADCLYITSALQGAADTGSMVVAPQTYNSLTYQTCEYRWGNQGTTVLEYALWDWGTLAAAANTNCVLVKHYGNSGCISDNNLWFIEAVTPGTPLNF